MQVLDIEKVIHGIAPAPVEAAPTDLTMEEAEVLGNARILVVDDSQVALQQSVHTLRNLGLTCHTARSAKEAIDVLLELQGTVEQINVVVSDIEMSEMDGYALTRTLRETPDFKDLYVLLHTSLDSAMNSEKSTPGRCRLGTHQVLIPRVDQVPGHRRANRGAKGPVSLGRVLPAPASRPHWQPARPAVASGYPAGSLSR